MAGKVLLFCSCIFFAFFSQTVEGGGTLELHLLEYYNHHGKDSTWDHCDSFFGLFKTSKCDPYFKIKMSGTNSRGDGISWGMITTQVYKETDHVRFGWKIGSSLTNPIIRHFDVWKGRFNMEIEVMDHDYISAHDHIDTLKMSTPFPADGVKRRKVIRGSEHGVNSHLSFSLTVKCDRHHYGPNCTKRCVPRNDVMGHYTCTENGEKKCLPTWHDLHTGCRRRDLCDPNPCLHGGNCTSLSNNYFQCACRPDYHGHTCAVRTKPCEAHNHCLHGGRCENVGNDSTKCKCPNGWTGHFCEVDVNECNSTKNPCQNGGICINKPGSFSCKCNKFFNGSRCEDDLDECMNEDPDHPLCNHNGTCVNNIHGFHCNCVTGYIGEYCDYVHPLHLLHNYYTKGTAKHIERHYLLLVLLLVLSIVLMCSGLFLWKREKIMLHIHVFVRRRNHPDLGASVHMSTSEDEPKLEFKNAVYEALGESTIDRCIKKQLESGVCNKAYITDDDWSVSSPKRERNSSETNDKPPMYTPIPEYSNGTAEKPCVGVEKEDLSHNQMLEDSKDICV